MSTAQSCFVHPLCSLLGGGWQNFKDHQSPYQHLNWQSQAEHSKQPTKQRTYSRASSSRYIITMSLMTG